MGSREYPLSQESGGLSFSVAGVWNALTRLGHVDFEGNFEERENDQ